jgi:type IV secretion system protein VirB9
MTRVILLVALAVASQTVLAARIPQPTATDQRIREVVYNASEVYEVTGSYRFTTTIEFEKGETVQYLTTRSPGKRIRWGTACI